MRKFIFFTLLTLLLSCSSDPIVYTLTATADPAEGGQVVPEYMEYGEGDTAYVVATPSDEYVLERWSGDASGNANTLVITMDKNKDVTAHFVKKKYPLTIKIEGEGEVKQEVIKQGMARDYNSGTIVKLTAEPDGEWLFVRWRGDLTGNENPTQITIDGPKTVVAEFEKKKYPLTIEIVGEGQVAEKVIKPGAPNDYNSGTIVELEALSGQSWEFSEWQVDLTGTQNPKQITINSPKTVRAVFVESSPVYLDENGVTIKAHDWAEVGQEGAVNGVTYKIIDREMLDVMIENGEDVTKVCTTKITSMKELFKNNESFNQDISSWDTSNITTFERIFLKATAFNQNISSWDVSNVIDMTFAFHTASSFNQDISKWNVSKVEIMSHTFALANSFNQDIGKWDVGNVKDFIGCFFFNDVFNQDLSNWDVSSATRFRGMFYKAREFNGDLSRWDTSNVTDMSAMFAYSNFNQDISNWDVSKVERMNQMFSYSPFNQPIGNWDTSNVIYMNSMFFAADSFNQPVGNWDTSNVTEMGSMFRSADSFNQDIGSWNVSNVKSTYQMFAFADSFNVNIGSWNTQSLEIMEGMFAYSNFNQPIGNWNTSNVVNMREVFGGNKNFNQQIGSWNTSNVTRMDAMFRTHDTFNQDISSWDVSNVTDMSSMFHNMGLFNQDLSSWDVSKVLHCYEFSNGSHNWTFPKPVFPYCSEVPNAHDDPIIGTWTLTSEEWIGQGTWPDGQARGCWKAGDGAPPDQYVFTKNDVKKTVRECDQDGNYISGSFQRYGPWSWSNQGNGSYYWAKMTIQVTFENNNTIMKLPFDDGNILQTWTKN